MPVRIKNGRKAVELDTLHKITRVDRIRRQQPGGDLQFPLKRCYAFAADFQQAQRFQLEFLAVRAMLLASKSILACVHTKPPIHPSTGFQCTSS